MVVVVVVVVVLIIMVVNARSLTVDCLDGFLWLFVFISIRNLLYEIWLEHGQKDEDS